MGQKCLQNESSKLMSLRMFAKMAFHIYIRIHKHKHKHTHTLIILHDSIDSLYRGGLFVNTTMSILAPEKVKSFLTS